MLTTVRDLLRIKGNDLWHVSPQTSVIDALNKMADKRIGALLVMEKGQIAGIVSERDFVRRIASLGTCKLDSPVEDVMTQEVITIHPDETIETCMEIMTEKHIRHLPVISQGKLLGLVSIGDVVKAIITGHEFTIEQLSKYIDGGAYNQ